MYLDQHLSGPHNSGFLKLTLMTQQGCNFFARGFSRYYHLPSGQYKKNKYLVLIPLSQRLHPLNVFSLKRKHLALPSEDMLPTKQKQLPLVTA